MAEILELQWDQPYHPSPLIEGDTIMQADLYKSHVLFLSMTPCSLYYSLPYTYTQVPVLTPHTCSEVGSGH